MNEKPEIEYCLEYFRDGSWVRDICYSHVRSQIEMRSHQLEKNRGCKTRIIRIETRIIVTETTIGGKS